MLNVVAARGAPIPLQVGWTGIAPDVTAQLC